jgi:AcrR family transcriptional regulator
MRAALEGLADLGYDLLSMEEIATRARVGKGALYRRWSSKAELVVDAMVRWRERVAPSSPPDTGSLLGDIDAMIARVPDLDETAQRQIAVLLGLLSPATRDAALQQALSDSGFARPRQAILDGLRRAAARGEIAPQVDIDLVPDIVIGLNLLRMVRGQLPDRAYVERVLRNVVYPLVADRPGQS